MTLIKDLEDKIKVSQKLYKILLKLEKKNPKQYKILRKKVKQIRKNPYRFKILKGNLFGIRRVHIDKSFVLIYEIDEESKTVILLDFDHHDNIY